MSNTFAISSPGPGAAVVLATTDPATLSDQDLVAFTRAADRQVAHANAIALAAVRVLADRAAGVQQRIVDELDGHAPAGGPVGVDRALARPLTTARRRELAERAGVIEVAQTLRLSQYSAARRIHLARQLADRLAPAGDALRAGQLTLGHAWVLAEHADDIDDDQTLTAVQAACLPRAPRQTPGNFGKSLTRALHALDPYGQAKRHREARRRARVYRGAEHEGMATLGIVATDPEAEWGYQVLDTLARAKLHQLKTHTTAADSDVDTTAGCGPDGVEATPPTRDSGQAGASSAAPSAGCGPDGVESTPSPAASDPTDQAPGRKVAVEPPVSACGRDGVEVSPALELLAVGAQTIGVERGSAPVVRLPATDPPACGRNGVDTAPRDTAPRDTAPRDTVPGEADPTQPSGGNSHRPETALPTLDQLRSQVFFDLLERAVTDPTFPTQHGRRRTETHIVIDLETLLGLRDDPATINGRPVPGPIARELASQSGSLRRLVTDPVLGHLLDYGDRREAPADLTEFLLTRDATCRIPHCNTRATACDLDHAAPHEHGGPTSAANEGALCRSHHPPKTAGLIDIVDSAADGSAVLITALGQRIPIPPRPVLPLPLDLPVETDHTPKDEATEQIDDEPPF